VLAVDDHQVGGELDQDEHLHLHLEDWDAAPPALDGFGMATWR